MYSEQDIWKVLQVLRFCPMKYRLNNMFLKHTSYTVIYGDLVYKLRRIKGAPKFVSYGSETIKRLRRRKYNAVLNHREV